MKLLLARHGLAEQAAASLNDFDRALTMRGRKRVRNVGKVLRDNLLVPDLIVTSPVVRAVQTAEIFAATLDPNEAVVVRQELAPGGDLLELIRRLALSGEIESTLLVGHEPSLSEVTRLLVGEEMWPREYAKAMVTILSVSKEHLVKLKAVVDPRTLDLHYV